MHFWMARDKASEWEVIERLSENGALPFALSMEAVCEPLIPNRDGKRLSPDELVVRLADRLARVGARGYVSCELDNLLLMVSDRDTAMLARLLQTRLGAKAARVVPSIRTTTPPVLAESMFRWARDARSGLALRVEGISHLEEQVELTERLLRASGRTAAEINLVVDSKDLPNYVPIRAIHDGFPLARSAGRWAVVGGSFPTTVTHLLPDEYVHILDRAEWQAYARQATRLGDRRVPEFGDYATQGSVYVPSQPYRPSPSVRYTTADAFVVLRGRRDAPEGAKQYIGHSRYLRSQPYFGSVGRSAAESYVEWIATGANRTGNGRTWRVASLTRHLAVAAVQVAAIEAEVGREAIARRT